MRIALSTVVPWASTGYGVVSNRFIESLRADGHEVCVFATVGTSGGGIVNWNGISVFPPLHGKGGSDIILAHVDFWKPDVVISLYDMWFAENFDGSKFNWICWNPVDHDNVPEGELKHIRRASKVVSMSKHGQEALLRAGIENTYIPLGISREFRIDRTARKAFRDAYGIEDDVFLFGCVGANTFFPSRKGFDYLIRAFKIVHDKYPKTKLLLHTWAQASHQAEFNLFDIMKLVGIEEDSIIFTDAYPQVIGLDEKTMRGMYNAMDCFVLPTIGEGFGLPVVEAQACGVPVIATDCTSMPELVFDQCGVLVPPAAKFFVPKGDFQSVPDVDGFANAMIDAYDNLKDPCPCRGATCSGWPWRDILAIHAKQYYWDVVYNEYWRPYLRKFAEERGITYLKENTDVISTTDSSERTED